MPTSSSGLTRRQKAVMDAARRFASDRGYMPSIAELAQELELAKSTVHFHVSALIRKGLLAHDGSDHGLRILDRPDTGPARASAVNVPVVGTIAAGQPIEAIEDHQESIAVEEALVARGTNYALRVRGTSMVEDGILDGDLVIVRQQQEVVDGEVAVALLEDGSATLKRVYSEKGRVRLQPANSAMQPIYARGVRIQGKVVGVLRLYS